MKSKKLLAAATAAFLAGSALPGIAAGWIEDITVRNGITLNLNGENVVPVDADGKKMPVFLYQSTTYVPVRYISEQYGKDVDWDPENATVYIADKAEVNPDDSQQNTDSISPNGPFSLCYLYRQATEKQNFADHGTFTTNGELLDAVLACNYPEGYITLPVDVQLTKYNTKHCNTFHLNVINPYGDATKESRLEVIGIKDGKEETLLDKRMKTITEDLDISNYDHVKIKIGEKGEGSWSWVLFYDSYFN